MGISPPPKKRSFSTAHSLWLFDELVHYNVGHSRYTEVTLFWGKSQSARISSNYLNVKLQFPAQWNLLSIGPKLESNFMDPFIRDRFFPFYFSLSFGRPRQGQRSEVRGHEVWGHQLFLFRSNWLPDQIGTESGTKIFPSFTSSPNFKRQSLTPGCDLDLWRSNCRNGFYLKDPRVKLHIRVCFGGLCNPPAEGDEEVRHSVPSSFSSALAPNGPRSRVLRCLFSFSSQHPFLLPGEILGAI